MARGGLDDLATFRVVAAEGSFTRAAARLGMSQSALSHAMRALEERLGVRLLARTTRSVSTTDAGEELLRTLAPALDDLDAALAALKGRGGTPAGTVRLTMTRPAAAAVMRPALPRFLASHPEVRVEIVVDDGFTDIVAARLDAGIRLGEMVDRDMVAVRVGPDIRAAVVAAPSYLAARPAPSTPRDLAGHACINYRLATAGGLYAWEFAEAGRRFQVRVDGPLVLNDGDLVVEAAIDGLGVAYVWEDYVAAPLADGRLVRLLEAWCPPQTGYHLYHPSRRQTPPALAALIGALRHRDRS